MNTYLEYTKDEEMLILLDFYKCYRAYVRVSDARLRHLKQLKAHFDSLKKLQNDMHLKINTEESPDACMRQILSHDYIFLTQQTVRAMKNLSL